VTASAATRRASPLPASEEPAEQPVPSFDGVHVLLMEPRVRAQLQLSGLLCGWGVALHLADDLEEALETVDDLERVDFVFIDALMPDDGACATIWALRGRLGDAPVVVGLIPPEGEAARGACLDNGADDLLSLPADAAALADLLNRHRHSSAGRYGT
jgi:CheY-like chemotaxis protein